MVEVVSTTWQTSLYVVGESAGPSIPVATKRRKPKVDNYNLFIKVGFLATRGFDVKKKVRTY